MSKEQEHEGYIVEFITVGRSVKVTAIDPHTMLEASVIGPTRATRKQLTALAVRKLEARIKRNAKH